MDIAIIFLVGIVGASAPEVIRLYSLRNDSGQAFSAYYVVISLLFAALGGFVAVILPATTLWGAFYAGVSTPTVVSTALKKGIEMKNGPLRNAGDTGPGRPRAPASFAAFLRGL